MTTNKPGTVTQQPLYGCTSCYEECTYPADHLHVYDGECWCDLCWDARRDDFPDQPEWGDLEPYTPAHEEELFCVRQNRDTHFGEMMRAIEQVDAMKAECEKLRKDADRWREIRKGGDSVRVVFTDWDAMKDYVLSNEEADAAIDEAMQTSPST